VPHNGAIIFRDLIGKLGVLRIECAKVRAIRSASAGGADREIWARRKAVHVVGSANGGLPAQAGAQRLRCVRRNIPDLPKVM
jgi:hypothetical protein